MKKTILDYTQGLQQYATGAQVYFDNSVIIEQQRQLKAGPEEHQPDIDPKYNQFQPFEVHFLKDAQAIATKSTAPGGRFMIYLPDDICVQLMKPTRMGFQVVPMTVKFWSRKNVQAQKNPDGFVAIDPTRSGRIFLYITRDLVGVVCFEEDKPDDKDILRSVLVCTVEKAPAGIVAKMWNYGDHMTQHLVGTYQMMYDPISNSVGMTMDSTPTVEKPSCRSVGNIGWRIQNEWYSTSFPSGGLTIVPGKILCVVMNKSEGTTSRAYDSVQDIIADQVAKSGTEYIFPLYKADTQGNVTVDFRLMPYVYKWV